MSQIVYFSIPKYLTLRNVKEGLDLCVVAGVVDGELVVWPGAAKDAVVGAARPVLDGDGLGGG